MKKVIKIEKPNNKNIGRNNRVRKVIVKYVALLETLFIIIMASNLSMVKDQDNNINNYKKGEFVIKTLPLKRDPNRKMPDAVIFEYQKGDEEILLEEALDKFKKRKKTK